MLDTHGKTDPSGQRCLEQLLADNVCQSAVHYQSTESSNALALADCQQFTDAQQLPRLYVADQQTAGRGRHGRSWHSGDGSLTFSLLVPWQLDAASASKLLSIAVGVAIARAIEFTYAPLRTRLKWPNDVYVDQGKVAGILIETNHSAADRVVIGVGINVNEAPSLSDLATAGPTQGAPPKSIAAAIGRAVPRYELLGHVVTQIRQAIDELAECEAQIITDFRARCLLTNQQISFQDVLGPRTGLCQGINGEGELVVKSGDQIHHCRSGEAHRLRIESAPPPSPH